MIFVSLCQYMLVGGMPQAVLEKAKEKDFDEVNNVKITHLNIRALNMNYVLNFMVGDRLQLNFDKTPRQVKLPTKG